ncbi:MAG: bifunctional helix-turn-helix transcriptional regulator/GNAT family N-acetyltransferase [Phycisphaerales bacterium]|nr:MAG: bifunctional helix-turn-helix transcriptional regulator/GNAT family N-acetyltransferase [Phycisphaerales bacterium]
MDYIRDLGALALASRMKRLVGRLNQDVKAIYAEQAIAFEPLLMPITRLLEAKGTLQANEIATGLGVSQPAVTQMCNKLKKRGLITVHQHSEDHRIRQIALLPEGRELAAALAPIWQEIEKAVAQMMEGADDNLLCALEAFEEQYARKPLSERVLQQLAQRDRTQISIVPYDESLKEAFKRLNCEWIETHFTVEPSDERVLSNPQKYVLEQGGFIYFAQAGSDIVGTYALLRVDAQTYEIAKMAVTATHQQRGIGTALLDHALAQARALGAGRLILYSNTRLAPAINLYFQKGFRVIPKNDYHNERANIKMELLLRR